MNPKRWLNTYTRQCNRVVFGLELRDLRTLREAMLSSRNRSANSDILLNAIERELARRSGKLDDKLPSGTHWSENKK